MKIAKDILKGLQSYSKAIPFIFKNGFGWLFFVPVLLNAALLFFGFYSVGSLTEVFTSGDWLKKENWDFWGGEVLNETLYWLIWIGLKIAFFFIFAYVGGFVVLILMSPILAYISELTDKKITERDYPFDFIQLLKDVWRGVVIAVRNMFLELFWMVLLFFFTFIPVIGWISPIIMFFISSYYYGFSFLDYNNERKRMSVKESTAYMRSNKGRAIGVGTLYALLLLIPVIGPMLSGFAAIISTVAAAITYIEIENIDSFSRIEERNG